MVEIKEIEDRWVESKRLISLLALLEHKYPEIMNKLERTAINAENISEMIYYALNFKTEYWVDKAVAWIEMGYPINTSIYNQLLIISTSKTHSQNLKHRSLKQVNQWQRKAAT